MDPELAAILTAIREQPRESRDEATQPRQSPEELCEQAAALSSIGERREAVDTLRRAVNLGEMLGVGSTRMIPILEAMAEILWQLGEKQEARMCANRALQLWFAARPSTAFDLSVDGATPS
jgi:tetratricopeptide (TPR) repeat protein